MSTERLGDPVRRRRAQKSLQSRFVRCAQSTGLYTLTTLMSTPDLPSEVTGLLEAINRGEPQAAQQLLPLVYDELRRLARSRRAGSTRSDTGRDRPGPRSLFAFGRRPTGQALEWPASFLGAAAEAMRRILVENARRKHRAEARGGLHRLALDHALPAQGPLTSADDLLALDERTQSLRGHSARQGGADQAAVFRRANPGRLRGDP